MQIGDIATLVYLAVAVVVGIGWIIFRERPNGSYPPEEGIVMSAIVIGSAWPLELVGIILIIALLFWRRETKWQ